LLNYRNYTIFNSLAKEEILDSGAEPHHFYAAPAPSKNINAAPARSLLYSKAKFLNITEVYTHV
jgi:hypothetical protein